MNSRRGSSTWVRPLAPSPRRPLHSVIDGRNLLSHWLTGFGGVERTVKGENFSPAYLKSESTGLDYTYGLEGVLSLLRLPHSLFFFVACANPRASCNPVPITWERQPVSSLSPTEGPVFSTNRAQGLTDPAVPAVNPKGTVPALVVPYAHTVDEGISTKFKALCSTDEICDFLDRSTTKSAQFSAPALSPATIQNADLQKEIIARVHGDEVDPNALLLVWRDEAERKVKAGGLPATFLRGRQEALERYAREVSSSDAKLSEFYANKLKENGGLLALLEGKGDSTDVQNKAKALWRNVGETVAYLEAQLDVKAPFLLGDQVSLAECVLSSSSSCLLLVLEPLPRRRLR